MIRECELEEGEGVALTWSCLVSAEQFILAPDLWLWLPVGNFECDTTAFSSTCCLYFSKILCLKLGNELLHIHFSILEKNIKFSNIIAWVDFNHSEETSQVLVFASTFFLFNFAVVHSVEAIFVGALLAFLTSVVLEVAFTE